MNQPTATIRARRHRRYNFSLRSFFIFVTLMAIVMGWVAYERAESRRELGIAEVLKARGAAVQLKGPFDDPSHSSENQPWWRAMLRNILGPRVEVVESHEEAFRDITPLAGLKNLETLYLDGTSIRDLTPLVGLKSLQWLRLDGTQVSDEQMKSLQHVLPDCKIMR